MCIGHTSASEDDSRNFKPHYETWFDSVQERSRFFLLNMKNVISVNNFQGIHTYKLFLKKFEIGITVYDHIIMDSLTHYS